MDKSNEEVLKSLKESINKSISANLISFANQPNKNKRIYSENVVKEMNNRLSNIDTPILIEQENGERILLSEPRLVYNPETSTGKFISFSLVGKPICKNIDIIIDKSKDIKL